MTTIKNDDGETARDQFGESANRAGRVGEFKFGSRIPDRRYFAFVHEYHNSLHADVSVATREQTNPLARRAPSSLIISAAKQVVRRKREIIRVGRFAGFVAVMVLCATAARAQDPAKTDPAHFKVELENDRARVLHVTVEPNTKIELHELDDAVVVPLSDYESTLKTANGQTTKLERIAGKPAWVPAGGREFEAGSKGVNALLIEIKRAPATK